MLTPADPNAIRDAREKGELDALLPPAVGKLGGARRPGKRSRRWDRDPEILARLDRVSQMLLQGAKLWQIAEALGYSITTAKQDCTRVRQLWLLEARDDVLQNRDRSIANLRYLQTLAWVEWGKEKDKDWLRIVRDCEKDIISLQGTEAPKGIDLTSKSVDLSKLSTEDLMRIAGGEDIASVLASTSSGGTGTPPPTEQTGGSSA